jgi:hypothetical protein
MAISEERRAYNRKWVEENQERIRAYRERTKEKRSKRRQELSQQDPSRRAADVERNRQRRINRPFSEHSYRYKISEREIELMLDGGCDICGAGLFDVSTKLEIDHNHHTGKVRGALCHDCNLAIGCMKDDPILLGNAIIYLLKEYQSHD